MLSPFGEAEDKPEKSWEIDEVRATNQVQVEHCNKALGLSCKIDDISMPL